MESSAYVVTINGAMYRVVCVYNHNYVNSYELHANQQNYTEIDEKWALINSVSTK